MTSDVSPSIACGLLSAARPSEVHSIIITADSGSQQPNACAKIQHSPSLRQIPTLRSPCILLSREALLAVDAFKLSGYFLSQIEALCSWFGGSKSDTQVESRLVHEELKAWVFHVLVVRG